ncbi:MAG: UDP-N-acetylglucosamine 1-carboxyvinyltransferase [Cellulosilyticaceae bacterium]
MSKYIIQGGKRLEGELYIDGSKNAVLPIIAATILTGSTTILHNCPDITDVNIMLDILKELGCSVKRENTTLIIDTTYVGSYCVPKQLVEQMRSSIIFLGSIIGRCKQAEMSYPGGCALGPRPINLHLDALKIMGVNVKETDGLIVSKTEHLQGATIELPFPSVGATENIILAAVLADGVTTIKNAAKEPEIVDLERYLNSCGAKIKGAGTNTISISGVEKLYSTEYTIMTDRIIAGSYLAAAAATRGSIDLRNVNSRDLGPVMDAFKNMGCKVKEYEESISLIAGNTLKGIEIITEPYPGFPTDMQPQFMAMLCMCQSESVITENIFLSRFNQVPELNKMGANISIINKQAIITPVKYLTGCEVGATDLRCGAALVIAGLIAQGKTSVGHTEYIKRGYHNIVTDLKTLGATIEERE